MTALALLLAACGQKGPLYLPAQAGVAAKPGAPLPPPDGASSPGAPAVAK